MEAMPSGARYAALRRPSSSPARIASRGQWSDRPRWTGTLGIRWTTSISGLPSFQRSRETRQLSAPKSMAIRAGSCMEPYLRLDSTQKCFGKTAIDRNQMACGAARARARQEQNRLSAVDRFDGLASQRPLGIKACQQIAQFIV